MANPKQLAKYVGFTESEVEALCKQYTMDLQETKRWYDGYSFRKEAHVYSPKSVVDAMLYEEFDSYWTQTETYEALKVYIDMNYDGLRDAIIKMLGGGQVEIDSHTFQNDMTTFESKDDVLTLLVHLGYLAYNLDTNEVYIPNEEVRAEFTRAIKASGWNEVVKVINTSKELLQAILEDDTETVADIVLLPRRKYVHEPAMVLELKWNKSADTAIKQIKEKQYGKSLENYFGEIVLVGISYDKESKKHKCLIERVEK